LEEEECRRILLEAEEEEKYRRILLEVEEEEEVGVCFHVMKISHINVNIYDKNVNKKNNKKT
jgi:hypothetical protein